MKGEELTTSQAEAIYLRVRDFSIYLMHLRQRMDEREFPPNDPLRLKTEAAEAAVHELSEALHAHCCRQWLNRP